MAEEEIVVNEEVLEESEDNDEAEPTVEQLLAERTKLRRENAKHRVEKQQAKSELEEFRAWKDSQKSELERAKDEANALKQELVKEKRSRLQIKAAKEAGLDLDLASRVSGADLDEMIEDAKELASHLKPAGAGAGDLGAGGRGSGVGSGTKKTDWLEKLWYES